MNSIEVFILLELFVLSKQSKFDSKILRNFRSIIIEHISRSSDYVSFMHNLTINSLSMDKSYCFLLMSFKSYVRKVQKVYDGKYFNIS